MRRSQALLFETTLHIRLTETMSWPVPVLFLFEPSDPFAVTAKITDPSGAPVVWRLSRDLLMEGIKRPVGQGSVRVEPVDCGRRILIHLSNCDDEATLQGETEPIARWLQASLNLVPRGTEGDWIDWDAELRELTSDAWPAGDD